MKFQRFVWKEYPRWVKKEPFMVLGITVGIAFMYVGLIGGAISSHNWLVLVMVILSLSGFFMGIKSLEVSR